MSGDGGAGPGPARLEVTGAVVRFGGVLALDEVDLVAEPGTIVGLIGPNGSGKTTLLNAISGLVPLPEGTVRLDGESLEGYLPEQRAAVGIVRSFQDCRLFPDLTVEDVLLVALDAQRPVGVAAASLQMPWARRSERTKRREVDEVVGAFGIGPFRRHRVSQVSTGTRRVVDLAAIVLARPRLLLLDEPTAGIAQREAEAFVPLLGRLREVADTTIVLVEHDVPLVFALCTRVVMMDSGRVVSVGTPDEVAADPPAVAAYLGASEAALAVSGPVPAGRSVPGGHGRAKGDIAPEGDPVGDP